MRCLQGRAHSSRAMPPLHFHSRIKLSRVLFCGIPCGKTCAIARTASLLPMRVWGGTLAERSLHSARSGVQHRRLPSSVWIASVDMITAGAMSGAMKTCLSGGSARLRHHQPSGRSSILLRKPQRLLLPQQRSLPHPQKR